jgi:hypothetical protein
MKDRIVTNKEVKCINIESLENGLQIQENSIESSIRFLCECVC